MSKINLIALAGAKGSGKDTVGKIIQRLTSNAYYGIEDNKKFREMGVLAIDDTYVYSPWQIKKFAEKLKQVVCILTGCTMEDLESEEFKDSLLPEYWRKWRVVWKSNYSTQVAKPFIYATKEAADEYIQDYANKLKIHTKETGYESESELWTFRKLLQIAGTEAGREILHPEIWVNATFIDYIPRPGSTIAYPHGSGWARGNAPSYKNGKNTFEIVSPESHPELFFDVYPWWIITDLRFPNEAKAVTDRQGVTVHIKRDLPNKKVDTHASENALKDYKFDYYFDNTDTPLEDLPRKVEEMLKYFGVL